MPKKMKKIEWWEIGWVSFDGEIVHGGIKSTMREVSKWVRIAMEEDPDSTYVIVPANDDALTEEDYHLKLSEEICTEEV